MLRHENLSKIIKLYLYIPYRSAHPPGVLKGLIIGRIRKFYMQNSKMDDYISIVQKFFQCFVDRGHAPERIRPMFRDAMRRAAITLPALRLGAPDHAHTETELDPNSVPDLKR